MSAIYRQEVIDRAREHAQAGWKVTEIRKLLRKEFRQEPHVVTIKGWIDPDYAERRRKETRKAKRRHIARNGKPRRDISPEMRLEKMKLLHEAGAGLRDIGIVSAVFWGAPLTAEQVRYRVGSKARRAA
jgi:hypothetical protein